MLKKSLKSTLEKLLELDTPLWMQVGGMSASISFGVLVFTVHQNLHSNTGVGLILLVEFLIVMYSVSTFSIYLTKRGVANADKLGLRKTMGATGWNLFLEVSAQTTLLMLLSMLLSVGIIDVSMLMAGLSFETTLHNIGVFQYGLLLLSVFLLSEGTLFIIQGIALAPNIKKDFNATTIFEKSWFLKLANMLFKISFVLVICIGLILITLLLFFVSAISIKILLMLHFAVLGIWYFYNKRSL